MEDLYRSDGKPKSEIARLRAGAVKGQSRCAGSSPTPWHGGRGYL